jgi:lipoprotein-anchoring transpeptidase ErfK/SrfK
MKRLLVLIIPLLATTAHAETLPGRYAPPPPIVLSPNLTAPWVMQLVPGAQPIYQPMPTVVPADPRLQEITVRPDPNRLQQQAAIRPEIDPAFLPTVVDYAGMESPGTIVINTAERYLYLVEADGRARRYGVGVGREGFSWRGTQRITRQAEWPDWRPPAEMRARQPGLPAFVAGGPSNPLGARALYLGSTLYRIHGSNEPWTIGHAVSSGCIRMRNEDVIDLYNRVGVGTTVRVI